MSRTFLLVTARTKRFNHTVVKPNFINPCCFGEDFAAWLQKEIADLANASFDVSDPIQEDYGWGVWVSRGKDTFWVAISSLQDDDEAVPAAEGEWVVTVDYDPGLNPLTRLFHRVDAEAGALVARRVQAALDADPDIRVEPMEA
jgi:hypothetical protein